MSEPIYRTKVLFVKAEQVAETVATMAGDGLPHEALTDGDPDGGWELFMSKPDDQNGWAELTFRKVCKHQTLMILCDNTYLEDVDVFMLDMKLNCALCQTPFHWVGFPMGCMLNEPAVNPDATELCVPVAPGAREIPKDGTMKFGLGTGEM
jgi:hypothetical protein